jgi:hypothetical protein
VRLERLGQLKNANDLIGNRTRDFPACSIMPQPTTLPRADIYIGIRIFIYFFFFYGATARYRALASLIKPLYIYLFNELHFGLSQIIDTVQGSDVFCR